MRSTLVLAALIAAVGAHAQQPEQAQQIDPLALNVLRTVLDPVKQAGTYSFHTRVSEERLATNGQMITSVREATATVSQPDRFRIDFQRAGRQIALIFNHGNVVLYAPAEKLYAKIAAPTTIEAALDRLEERNIAFPTSNLFRRDPYASLSDDLTGAYVVRQTTLDGARVLQLAFTEPGATWQVWVEDGATPLPKRLEIVYLNRPGQPRVTVEFSDWKFGSVDPALFAFTPPPGAHEIQLLTLGTQGD